MKTAQVTAIITLAVAGTGQNTVFAQYGYYPPPVPYEYRYYVPAPQFYLPEAPHLRLRSSNPRTSELTIRRESSVSKSVSGPVQNGRLIRPSDVAGNASLQATRYSREEIKNIQAQLNRLGYSAGIEDGELGARTNAALNSFKRDKGISEVELMGAQTRQKLLSAVTTASKTPEIELNVRNTTIAPNTVVSGTIKAEPSIAPLASVQSKSNLTERLGGAAPETASGGLAPVSANPFYQKERVKIRPISLARKDAIHFSFSE